MILTTERACVGDENVGVVDDAADRTTASADLYDRWCDGGNRIGNRVGVAGEK